ncbi:von Willebrand factor A domain-containing protein 3A [Holothuria leucospilota]|uniref:von Willebrand factor A domain-containing protein 3A n=1 Tax=Holothuria leucospilota TaxID=206669 RepID=A0A9Q1HI77_HOLLE|nr:von Willebrand factor A domain-containing protein 3A [Holothuria leucospilota]
MASIPVHPPKVTPTMIGTIEEKNVTFLIDTSGSMYSFLPVVKEHLIEALLTRAFKEKDTMFNIVEFSSTVTPWADKMVKCTPQTVMLAGEWLRQLESSTGTNTLDALVVAFTDPVCEGVYLITDGLPDQSPNTILKEVAKVGQGRPVHCIYLVGASADTPAHEFLESLAVQTSGTFHLISLTQEGNIEKVTSVVQADHAGRRINNPVYTTHMISSVVGENNNLSDLEAEPKLVLQQNTTQKSGEQEHQGLKYCSVKTSLDYNPLLESETQTEPVAFTSPSKIVRYPGTAWEAYRPPRLVRRLVTHSSPLVADKGLIQGMRVLAKRDRDGYYCPGTLTEEINPQRTLLITFDRDPKGPKMQHLLQETALYGVIAYNDAMRHTITPGDKVLSPWEKEAYRLAPGIVLEGIEGRSSGCAADTDYLIVSLFNGKTEKVPKQKAVWIPGDLFERIKLEIQMPLTARQFLINDPRYPVAAASYQTGQKSFSAEYETVSSLGNHRDAHPYLGNHDQFVYHIPSMNRSAFTRDDINMLIPGTNMTKDELHDKVMRQLAQNSIPQNTDYLKLRFHCGKNEDEKQKRVSFEEKREDSLEDSGVSLDKEETEDDGKVDSGCEEDQLVDTGVQTLSLVDTGSMTDSLLLHRQKKETTLKEQPMWRYWKQTPQPRSKGKIGPFRETSLSAPMEAKIQPRYVEPTDYVGSLSQSTSFDDRDIVKQDNAQREWQYRQPVPPNFSYEPLADRGAASSTYSRPTTAPRPSTAPRPDTAHFKSRHESVVPAYFAYEHVGPPNRSAAFNNVDRSIKSDRAQLEWQLRNPQPPHVPVTQGPGRPLFAILGTRDMIREGQQKVMMDRRRQDNVKREAQWKGKEYDAIRQRGAKEERNRLVTVRYQSDVAGVKIGPIDCQVWKFTADVIQRDAYRQMNSEKQVAQTQMAKRVVSASIRNQEETREERARSREQMRMDALTQRQQRRADIQSQREREIENTIKRRQVRTVIHLFINLYSLLPFDKHPHKLTFQTVSNRGQEWAL